jgi:hypothetical protein
VPITVLDTNRLPVIQAIESRVIKQGEAIDIPVTVSDENGDALQYGSLKPAMIPHQKLNISFSR